VTREHVLTELDRKVLTEIQSRFPVEARPYAALADRLGSTEAEVFERVERLRHLFVIRRLGATFDSLRLGYVSTLAAISSPAGRMTDAADILADHLDVTHVDLREDAYDLWFTVVAESRDGISEILEDIRRSTGASDVLDLPAERLFKIQLEFDYTGRPQAHSEAPPVVETSAIEKVDLSAEERELARFLQDDLPLALEPFTVVAEQLRVAGSEKDVAWVLATTRQWVASGLIRRLGAIVRHHNTGYIAHAMGVWACPGDRILEAGRAMAGVSEVSHCYQRPRMPQWPYDLYAMIHGTTREECQDVAAAIRDATGLGEPRLLFETREFKKTAMRFFEG
jgi:siroheme decarboxylase